LQGYGGIEMKWSGVGMNYETMQNSTANQYTTLSMLIKECCFRDTFTLNFDLI